jgi:hypothetical protein
MTSFRKLRDNTRAGALIVVVLALLPITSLIDGRERAQVGTRSSDHNKLNNIIDDMRGTGCTNLTIGAAWGGSSPAKGQVLATAAPASAAVEITTLLATGEDGTNRSDRDRREGGPDAPRTNVRTKFARTTVKGEGIRFGMPA